MGEWFQVIASGLHDFRPAMRQNIMTTEVLGCKTKSRGWRRGQGMAPRELFPVLTFLTSLISITSL